MKSLFLSLLLYISLVSIGQSTYHKFLEPNKIWDVANYTPPQGNTPCSTTKVGVRYQLSDDTIINNNSYKIIKKPILSSIGVCNSTYHLSHEFKIDKNHFLREDTIAQKVYLWLDDTKREYTLYDFSLQKGDTLKTFLTTGRDGDAYLIVSKINSVLLQTGEYHKKWHFDNGSFYIEGVGSDQGFLETLMFFEAYGELKTVLRGNEVLYGQNTFIVLDTKKKNLQEKIELYPNPIKNTLNIKSLQNIGEIRIYDVAGKLVLVIENKSQIDCTELKEGVFYIEIFDENHLLLQRQKIIK